MEHLSFLWSDAVRLQCTLMILENRKQCASFSESSCSSSSAAVQHPTSPPLSYISVLEGSPLPNAVPPPSVSSSERPSLLANVSPFHIPHPHCPMRNPFAPPDMPINRLLSVDHHFSHPNLSSHHQPSSFSPDIPSSSKSKVSVFPVLHPSDSLHRDIHPDTPHTIHSQCCAATTLPSQPSIAEILSLHHYRQAKEGLFHHLHALATYLSSPLPTSIPASFSFEIKALDSSRTIALLASDTISTWKELEKILPSYTLKESMKPSSFNISDSSYSQPPIIPLAARLLGLVEDLYLACASGEGDSAEAGGAEMDRATRLRAIFGEQADQVERARAFLLSCGANQRPGGVSDGGSLDPAQVEDMLLALQRTIPDSSVFTNSPAAASIFSRAAPTTPAAPDQQQSAATAESVNRMAEKTSDITLSPVHSRCCTNQMLLSMTSVPMVELHYAAAGSNVRSPLAIRKVNNAAKMAFGFSDSKFMSRLRFFAPAPAPSQQAVDAECQGSAAIDAAVGSVEWYHAIYAALQTLLPAEGADARAVEAAVAWLLANASLCEVAAGGGPGRGCEDLLSAIRRCATSPDGAAPLVVLDTATNAFYGVDASSVINMAFKSDLRGIEYSGAMLWFSRILGRGSGVQSEMIDETDEAEDARGDLYESMPIRKEPLSAFHFEGSTDQNSISFGSPRKVREGRAVHCSSSELLLNGPESLEENSMHALKVFASSGCESLGSILGDDFPLSCLHRERGGFISITDRFETDSFGEPRPTPSALTPGSCLSVASQKPKDVQTQRANKMLFSLSQASLRMQRVFPDTLLGTVFQHRNGIAFTSEGESDRPSTVDTNGFAQNPIMTQLTMRNRGHDVNAISVATITQRLQDLGGSIFASTHKDVPTEVLINDRLMLFAISEAVQQIQRKRSRSSSSRGLLCFIDQCEMHLVIDIVPADRIPPDEESHRVYSESIHSFYTRREAEQNKMEEKQLFSAGIPALFTDRKEDRVDPFSWVKSVIALSALPLPGNPTEAGISHRDISTFLLSDGHRNDILCDHDNAFISFCHDCTSSPETSHVSLPSVWAVQVGDNLAEKSVVHPKWYLSDELRELLVNVNAAVVVTGCGAATIAFPFITHERLDFLKKMHIITQPRSAIADMGIVTINHLVKNAMRTQALQDEEKNTNVPILSLGYGAKTKQYQDEMANSIFIEPLDRKSKGTLSSTVPPPQSVYTLPRTVDLVVSTSSSPRTPHADNTRDSKADCTTTLGSFPIFVISDPERSREKQPEVEIQHNHPDSGILLRSLKPALALSGVTDEAVYAAEVLIPPPSLKEADVEREEIKSPNGLCVTVSRPTALPLGLQSGLEVFPKLTTSTPTEETSSEQLTIRSAFTGTSFTRITGTSFTAESTVPSGLSNATRSSAQTGCSSMSVQPRSSDMSPMKFEEEVQVNEEGETSFIDYCALPRRTLNITQQLQTPYFRVLILYATSCADLVEWLIALGHSVTVVTCLNQMAGFLRCDITIYDVIIIEWSTKIMTPKTIALLEEAKKGNFAVPIFYCLLDDKDDFGVSRGTEIPDSHPPLPPDVKSHHVLRGRRLFDVCVSHRMSIRSQIRLGRMLKDVRGDKTMMFQVTGKIGSGAFGDVFEVSLYASKGRLAMKRIPFGTISAERMEELYKEVSIMRELDHRNIVQLSHITCDITALNLFMELCDCSLMDLIEAGVNERNLDGSTLSKLTTSDVESQFQKTLSGESLSANNSAENRDPNSKGSTGSSIPVPKQYRKVDLSLILRDTITGIAYLHSYNIAHRDIKPQNILFLDGVAKIADFGSATTVSVTQQKLHSVKGTLPYMAPEVFLGESYGKSCDIWSLGILFAEILGLHLAHFSLLHFPALEAFYRGLSKGDSMPVVATNYVSTQVKKHFSDELIKDAGEALEKALSISQKERQEDEKLFDTNTTHSSGSEGGISRSRLSGKALLSSRTRTVLAIEVDTQRLTCSVSQHNLPASLIELLESTFHRCPDKRITAEQLLEHPIANDRDWLKAMFMEVRQLNYEITSSKLASDSGNDDHGYMDLSVCNADDGSGDDLL